MVKLSVNIDHIATIRQTRLAQIPDPIYAATLAELAGADGITVHLREDRRHIQDRDVKLLRQVIKTKLNLEMAATDEMLKIASEIKPDSVCLVPEKRQELTTEGGLDVIKNKEFLVPFIMKLQDNAIAVSIFIDPDIQQIKIAKKVGANKVELHTGNYANAKTQVQIEKELEKLKIASEVVIQEGLILNAGHGLDYKNIYPIASIPNMNELSIGFSIIARAVFVGLYQAVKEMKEILNSVNFGHLSTK